MTSQKSLRKIEVEKKKEKLAALRAEKAKQEEERKLSVLRPIHPNTEPRHTATKEELDQLLKSVGIVDEPQKTPVKSKAKSPLDSMEDCENDFDKPPDVFVKPLSPALVKVKSEIKTEKIAEHANPHLIPHALFAPLHKKEINRYSKAVQTDVIEVDVIADECNNDTSVISPVDKEPTAEEVTPLEELKVLEKLTEEDKQTIMNLAEFQVFLCNASKIIEKQLEIKRENDAFINYTQAIAEKKSGELLTFGRVYKDPKWTNNRSVTAMEFCSQYKELVAVAYGPNSEDPHGWRGVVCIWNTKFEQQPPEFLLYCYQQLSYITFCPTNRHFLYGGCTSGQILIWDTRIIHKKLPVYKSPISGQAHTFGILNLYFTGTRGENMYTISSDGKICIWDGFGSLSLPNYCNDFQCRPEDLNIRSVPTTAACFNADGDCFVVGSEDGLVFEYLIKDIDTSRHASTIVKADEIPKIDPNMGYKEGKETPVLAVHFHVATGAIDYSHLFLVSTFDWAIHLYSRQEPLWHIRFDVHQAPVTDVKWSPVHPAVFASIDLSGTLCLWNLIENVDDPVLTIQIEGELLTKLAWSLDGKKICVGDGCGTVTLYNCGESLYNVKNETFYKLSQRLTEVKHEAEMREAEAKQAEAEENEMKAIQSRKTKGVITSLQDVLQK